MTTLSNGRMSRKKLQGRIMHQQVSLMAGLQTGLLFREERKKLSRQVHFGRLEQDTLSSLYDRMEQKVT